MRLLALFFLYKSGEKCIMEGIERGGLPPSPTKTKPGLELLGVF